MRRTTVHLDEAVYLQVEELSRRKGQSLARTIGDLLRAALGSERPASTALPPLHRDNGPRPGVDIADRERLYDRMGRE